MPKFFRWLQSFQLLWLKFVGISCFTYAHCISGLALQPQCLIMSEKHRGILYSSPSRTLCYDISVASSKANFQTVQRTFFQYLLPSLRWSSSYIRPPPRLPYPPIFPWIMRFSSQLLRTVWLTQVAFIPFVVCRLVLSSFTQCNTIFHTIIPAALHPSSVHV
jgi:hypothetical protein